MRCQPPAPHCYHCPDSLNQSEGPRSLKKTVYRTEHARYGECQDEPSISILQGIEHDHGAHGEESKKSKMIQAIPLEDFKNSPVHGNEKSKPRDVQQFPVNAAVKFDARADARSAMQQNRSLLAPETAALPAKSIHRTRRNTPPTNNAICISFPNHIHAGNSHEHQQKRDGRSF